MTAMRKPANGLWIQRSIMAKVTWEKCALQLSSNEHRHLIKWPHFQKCWTSCSSAWSHYTLFPKCWAVTLSLTLLRPQHSPGDGQRFRRHTSLTYLLKWQTTLAFLPLFCFFSSLKILKQNSMYKTVVKWNNRKTYLFNAVASSDWHLTQSILAFRTDRQVTDKPTVIREKMTLEHNDALLF